MPADEDETEPRDSAEILLPGGLGSAGLVVRRGDTVRRPWRESTPATHALLRYLAEAAPGVAPVPLGGGSLGRDEQGREVLTFVDGDVALPPFPAWVATERYLTSLGQLLRRIHDALESWDPPPGLRWSGQIPDPRGGPLITHTDVRPENVVARDGQAVAIIDWEFAAPGRRIWDVVGAARFCVPFTSPQRRDPVYDGLDVLDRLRIFLDAYGLGSGDRAVFAEVLDERRRAGEAFTRRRVEMGEGAFVDKWGGPEGERRMAVERDWVRAWVRDWLIP